MNYNSYGELLLAKNALQRGEFTTKSGRPTSYFVDTGKLHDGQSLMAIGALYARALKKHFSIDENIILFGPAYKAIPLVVTVCQAVYDLYHINLNYCFNRKEAKDHGEGGIFVGKTPKENSRVIIIEDVLTAGTSIRETIKLLSQHKVEILGALVGLDRQEIGQKESAKLEVIELMGAPLYALCSIDEILDSFKF